MQNYDPEKLCKDVSELKETVNTLAVLIPYIQPIQQMFASDIAGTGSTESMGIPIPPEEFSKTSPPESAELSPVQTQSADMGNL